ncbi:PREDICTED: F-box/kelch-repeat protein SKIP25-like [Ipomoea nil]|uniref:F-box/kelch-repeat protein SKIP25-like n=1 Tax=Ipomoea nil TaxID=35883 RepID=UPI0009009982|nr:PREDICTED: F-box/kelch-repeat protein SKIP25-like [Ipomoea nil]
MAPNLIPCYNTSNQLSMVNPITATIAEAVTASSAVKRRKNHHRDLIPGLPDHIAQTCLSSVHPSLLYSVCHSWRRLIYSPSFPPFLSIYAVFSSSDSLAFASFDPISSAWKFLPLPPPTAALLLRHPSFISRRLPVQSVAVAGNLVLLAATADKFLPALSRPLIFNPPTGKWTCGPQLSTPRRWCAAGASGRAVYVASGIGSHYNHKVARSVEKWDLKSNDPHYFRRKPVESGWRWEKMGGLRDGKFSRDAIDAVGWRGKLCMVNVTGDAAKEGIIYDVGSDAWEEMPAGMLMGWRGPAAALDEETIYMVDESKGALRRYEPERDLWVEVTENQMLKGAQHITAGGGRVCVSCAGGEGIAVVDVVANPPSNMWVVDTPPGFQVLSVHILPRTNQNDFQPSD